MRKKLILILIALFLLTGYSTAYAEEQVITEEVITLEKAVSLAKENSRNLAKYELNRDIAKYKMDQVEEQRNNDWNSYNNMYTVYSKLLEDYNEAVDPDVISRLTKEIQEQENKMEAQYEKLSSSSSIKSAENTYKDSEKQVEKYLKQLEYEVEQHYIKILTQEESLETTKKELELKQALMKAESAKLQLGNSTRTKLDQLSTEVTDINIKIIETINSLNVNKIKLNDIMGRDLNTELMVEHFNVPEKVDSPEYEALLSKVNQEYDGLYKLKRDIDDSEDDLDSKTDYYERRILSLEIKSKELQLEDEKNNLNELVANLISNIMSKQEDYKIALVDLRNEQRAYEWAKKRYELGQISKHTLMQSELTFLSVKNKKTSVGYDFHLTQRSVSLAEVGII